MAPEKQKNHFWTDGETFFMLRQLKEMNILNFIDGRRTRNAHLYKKVAGQLEKAGYSRTAEQIRVRWKHVKQNYKASKKNPQTSEHDRELCPYWDLLEELLGGRPLTRAGDHGADIGSSSESVISVEVDSEETIKEEQSESEADEDSPPRVSELAPDRERSRTPPLERASSIPAVDLPVTSVGTTSQQSGRRRRRSDFDLVFRRMEEMNRSWRQHLEQSDERAERMVNSIIQSNATVVSSLLEGIRSLQPAVAPQPTMSVKHEKHD